MHSHITVIIPNSSEDIYSSLKRILEPYRLDEDNIKSIRSRHWDYWYFPSENLIDEELRSDYSEDDSEILNNSCYVRNLPEIYYTSGVILPNGPWIDLQDFGWRMLREPSSQNGRAWGKWQNNFHRLLDQHKEHICTQVICHS
ncbi:hypothetical protein [Leptospira adleri]|uniref:hypothetical protein n=1 Tax=Leptospira adleri TaxID=2023186 RepID=UPI00108382F8|nr:hypothetical protein [Leptospira adleri]TGM58597.1 hypothetical protein EHQ97_05725 [Leptospira adleri]